MSILCYFYFVLPSDVLCIILTFLSLFFFIGGGSMGVKDGLMNKMISSMLGKVDFEALQKQLGSNGGKIDSNMINSVMASMLGGKSTQNQNEKNNNNDKMEDKKQNKEDENVAMVNELIKKKTFGYEDVCKIIPQRPPFLMIDKVLNLDVEKKSVICQKVLSANEGFFIGHFPNRPVMPGVLMIEAMAQASSIIGKALMNGKRGVLLFAEVDNVKFSGSATVGDVLIVEAYVDKIRDPLVVGRGVVKKGDEVICKCDLKAFRKEL